MVYHDRGVPRPRHGVCRVSGVDLRADGRLVPLIPHTADRDDGDSVLTRRHDTGARRDGRVFHRDLDDRLHGRCEYCGRNSIILVDFIEQCLCEGMPLAEAVVDAGAVRFRPMLLTAMAVVVGASVMFADPIFQGLAISLMAGEVASLLISRMAVPVLFFMAYSRKPAAK